MKEQFELSLNALRKENGGPGLPPHIERSLRRQFAQAMLMQYLRRPNGQTDALLIAQEIAEAEARLSKPMHKAEPIEPMRPETWQTAMLVTRKAQRVLKEDAKRARLRKHNMAHTPKPRYFKCGHKLINRITGAVERADKHAMDVAYAS